MRDVVVAGGGPVGLAVALRAARAGLDVVVREPRAGVVDKACGEGLMPGAVAALADLGVRPTGHPITGIRYVDGTVAAAASFRAGPGLGVRRTGLHADLQQAAVEAGVDVDASAVRDVVQHDDHVVVDGEPARFLVGADGLHSTVRRVVGLDTAVRGHRRFGLRRHFAVAPTSSMVEVHWAPDAEAYLTPVADDEVGLAVLTSRPEPYEALLDRFPLLRDRLAGAAPTSAVRGAGPLRQVARRPVAGRVLLVGDASGYVDALTGEGISVGLAQARVAVDAVLADDPATYARRWRTVSRRYRLLTSALLAASNRTVVRRRLVGVAAARPRVFAAAVDQLARPA